MGGAVQLAQQGGYAIDDIATVEADFRSFSLACMQARDEEQAGFCAPYLIAASLVHGAFGPDQITPAAIEDPRVRKLSGRGLQIPKTPGDGNEGRLPLRDGRVLSAAAPGERPFGPARVSRQ